MDGWRDFYLAQVGASAALGGLVFVGVSINLDKIMASPHLPNRALESLMLLLAILTLASLALVPALPPRGFGAEALGVGIVAWAAASILHRRNLTMVEAQFRGPARTAAAIGQAVTLLLAGSGLVALLGFAPGAYGVVAALMLGYLLVFIHAWVLLVEINR